MTTSTEAAREEVLKAVHLEIIKCAPGFNPFTINMLGDQITDAVLRIISAREEAARREAFEEAANAVPTNWLDPLLTGPNKVIPDNADSPVIENLLRAVKKRIQDKASAIQALANRTDITARTD